MFACVFIPDFPVAAIIRGEPELRSQPVAVLSGRPPLEKVIALNERARELGVETEATKTQLEAWEELILRPRSEALENSAHNALLDCAQTFSPELEDTAPDTAILNLAGLEPLLGSPEKIARELAARASQMELEVNVAVAANPDGALLAAHGFSGITLILAGQETQRLGNLAVDALFESFARDAEQAQRWLETFDRWGIRNLRALGSLPEVPVSERLGQEGIRLQKLARGACSRSLRLLEPLPVFAESVELEHPIVLLEPLAFLLNRLLEQVCRNLAEHALAAQELNLKLTLADRYEDCEPQQTSSFTRTLRLPVPMLDARVFLKLLQLDLQAHPPGAPIVKIHLSAEPARPRATQSGLFQPVFPEPEKLELTLARIAGIVGKERVGSAELLDTHREGVFAMRHFAPVETQEKQRKKEVAVQEEEELETVAEEKMNTVIALRLFRPPLEAVVNVREGKPVKLKCIHRPEIAGEIVWSAGPWRSSGDWADQEGWSREEWDIAIQSGNSLVLYRLVQDKTSVRWLLEGTYD